MDLFYGKVKYGKMLEHKIAWEVLKICIQECSNDNFGLTLSFYGKIKFAFWPFIWVEFMDFVEDFGAKVN